jgi:hypothetical protein
MYAFRIEYSDCLACADFLETMLAAYTVVYCSMQSFDVTAYVVAACSSLYSYVSAHAAWVPRHSAEHRSDYNVRRRER